MVLIEDITEQEREREAAEASAVAAAEAAAARAAAEAAEAAQQAAAAAAAGPQEEGSEAGTEEGDAEGATGQGQGEASQPQPAAPPRELTEAEQVGCWPVFPCTPVVPLAACASLPESWQGCLVFPRLDSGSCHGCTAPCPMPPRGAALSRATCHLPACRPPDPFCCTPPHMPPLQEELRGAEALKGEGNELYARGQWEEALVRAPCRRGGSVGRAWDRFPAVRMAALVHV